jgi:AraC-like DNA-binding protein
MDNWDNIDAVSRMQQYINRHLDRPITLHDLASAAGYSPWHSARLFKELTGRSPFDYIRALRLSKAALRLQNRPDRVTDVALDFVFGTPEGFTRAFSKAFGQTPKAFQMNPHPVRLFMPPQVRETCQKLHGGMTMSQQKPASVFVQVIDRPARKLILKRGVKADEYFAYCDEVGCDIWEVLTGIKDALYEPLGLWLPLHLIKPGTSEYVQGVEMPADYSGPVPEGYDIIDLPPCKLMVFQGEPFEDEQFGQAIADLNAVMENYNPEIYGFRWADDDAPFFQMEPQGYRGYIAGRPVRPVAAD